MLHDFIKETLKDIKQDKDLISCHQNILNLINFVMESTENIISVYEHDSLLKTIMIFQSFYSINVNYKVNL